MASISNLDFRQTGIEDSESRQVGGHGSVLYLRVRCFIRHAVFRPTVNVDQDGRVEETYYDDVRWGEMRSGHIE